MTDLKFDENNYLLWKWVSEIYVASRGKISRLLVNPPTLVTDAWALEDNLPHEVLT